MAERQSWLTAVRHLFAGQSTAPLQSRMCLLDGLRGLAAFAVIFFHYDHFLQRGAEMTVPEGDRGHMPLFRWLAPLYDHGNLAVQVFWIISGFVFAAVYYGRGATTRSFVVNRFARLYPLHFVTLCLVALLQVWAVYQVGHWLIFGNNTPANFIKQLLFYAWNSRTGWSFNGPIWSVSVEAVIYLLFWLSHRHLPRFGVAGPGAACVLSMALMSVFGHNVVLSCSYYFFFGSTLAVLQSRLPSGPLPKLAAALAALGGAIVIARGSHDLRDYVALPVTCAGTVLLLGWFEAGASRSLRRVASRWRRGR